MRRLSCREGIGGWGGWDDAFHFHRGFRVSSPFFLVTISLLGLWIVLAGGQA